MKKTIFLILFLNSPCLIFAEVQQITIREAKLKVLKLHGWQKAQGFLGGDITWIGPELQGPRPVIKLDMVKKKKWDFNEEKKATKQYLENKEEWLRSKQGRLIASKLAQTNSKMNAKHIYNEVDYTIDGQDYKEQDWLIKCPTSLLNLSLLITPERLTNLKGTWNEFISSFKCMK